MGSRGLTNHSPHEPIRLRSPLAKVKPTTRPFRLIFEVGMAELFWQLKSKRRLIRRASRAVVSVSCGSLASDGNWESLLRKFDFLLGCSSEPQLRPDALNSQRPTSRR